jgi:ketosteroid isomerase-like protein
MKYDEAINKHDAAAVAARYTQDAVWATPHDGAFHGPHAIKKNYAKWDSQRWHAHNFVKTIDRVIAVGNEVRAYGTWSCTYQETTSAPRNEEASSVRRNDHLVFPRCLT